GAGVQQALRGVRLRDGRRHRRELRAVHPRRHRTLPQAHPGRRDRAGVAMAKDLATHLRIKPGDRVRLDKLDPGSTKGFADKKSAKAQSEKDSAAISEWQQRLYAEGRRALLVILQGTDTAGKDSTIQHVFHET